MGSTDSYLKHPSESTPTRNFAAQYPLSAALNIPVFDAAPGFDELEVEQNLGRKRFDALMRGVKVVFACNHRLYASGDSGAIEAQPDQSISTHRVIGYEVHCLYAEDLEAFLATEGGK